MNKPLINASSDLRLSQLFKDMPQSLLLTGPVGVGLGTIASYIADEVGDVKLTVLPEKDEKIDLEKGVISIDSVRRLYDQTKSIQTGKLVIVIDYAERMGLPAQNAFLKLLEEPGKGVYFILATHTPSKLLPTVTSRAQLVNLKPISSAQTAQFLNTLGVNEPKKRSQLEFMAFGLPAELARLASDDKYFEVRSSIVRDARDLLQASTYRKLQIANNYKDNREQSMQLIDDATGLLKKSITANPDSGLILQIDKYIYARQQIQANGNIRMCLARLVL
jgi:DNA polymerase III delta prime subunit